MAGVQIDGVNNKIDFDDDLDTSISANTDDTLVIEAGGVNISSITAGEFAINEGSADIDFRVESNGATHMLFVDGGNDKVGIGASSLSGTLHVKNADNTSNLHLECTDADANSGPLLTFDRNSSSPADSDILTVIDIKGRNDAGQTVLYAEEYWQVEDMTDGTEDAQYIQTVILNGTNRSRMAHYTSATVFNDDSQDIDFRVESNALTHAFFIDAGTDHVSINNSSTSLYTLDIKQNGDFTGSNSDTANEAPLRVWSTNNNGRGAIAVGGNNNNGIFNKGTSDLVIQGYNAITFDCSQTNDDKFGTKTERMTISNNGRVYIGHSEFSATDTNLTFFPEGQMYFAMNSSSSTNVVRFYNTATGNIGGNINMSGDSTSYNSGSDYRLKDNVNYSFDATTRLKQLKPARFNFINTPDTTVDGFLAHEAQTVVPESVTGVHNETETRNKVVVNSNGIIISDDIEEDDWTAGTIADEEGNTKYPSDSTWEASKVVPVYQSIDHSKMVPLLVKTIQELEARIEALEG